MSINRKEQICERCREEFSSVHIQRFCSKKCANKIPWNKGKKIDQTSGDRNGNWKGDSAGYQAIHSWLVRNHGLADKCEHSECPRKSTSYEYALIHGREYSRDIKNFIKLCQSCHRKYDFTEKETAFVKSRNRDSNGRFL